jgi:hypothetical protein
MRCLGTVSEPNPNGLMSVFRSTALEYAALPGECWIPVPLPPPALPPNLTAGRVPPVPFRMYFDSARPSALRLPVCAKREKPPRALASPPAPLVSDPSGEGGRAGAGTCVGCGWLWDATGRAASWPNRGRAGACCRTRACCLRRFLGIEPPDVEPTSSMACQSPRGGRWCQFALMATPALG